MQQRKGWRAGVEGLARQVQHHRRVLAYRIEHDRPLALASHLAEDVDAFGLEPFQMGQRHRCSSSSGSDASGGEMRVVQAGLAVAQRHAVEVAHFATGGAQDRVAGGDVPFHGAAQAWVEVGLPRRQQAQLQRRAGAHRGRHPPPRQECVEGGGIAMGTTGDHRQPRFRHRAAVDRPAFAGFLDECLATAVRRLAAGVQTPQGGRQHHPQAWAPLLDQGDVDGELAIAADEFLGAVQGIDQPETRGRRGQSAPACGLFGNGRHLGKALRQGFEDRRFGRFVGKGDRRSVILAANLEVGRIDLQNHRSRTAGGFDGRIEQ
ncbi:hypothetical protein AC96_5203 [Escherichia coli 2-156-04_S4_C2]|nr:hypothetical protein AC96_5203 [Escherichia coli 2-156-04_S4_C2]